MPMHDWTRVTGGVYHSMHNSWITHLSESLNAGLLPPAYYALGEQWALDINSDVLTLRTGESATAVDESWTPGGKEGHAGLLTLDDAPPQVSLRHEIQEQIEFYIKRQRSVVVRRVSGDRVVALIEIVSPANKHARRTLEDFADKVVAALQQGVHVLVIDPLPPGKHDPLGIHGAVFERLDTEPFEPPADCPLTLVSYQVAGTISAWIEPLCVGVPLIDMPLFLTQQHYVNVPLEPTYLQSWAGVPQRWKRVIEAQV